MKTFFFNWKCSGCSNSYDFTVEADDSETANERAKEKARQQHDDILNAGADRYCINTGDPNVIFLSEQ